MAFSIMTIAIQSAVAAVNGVGGGEGKGHHRVGHKLPTCGSGNWRAVRNDYESKNFSQNTNTNCVC